MDKSLNKVSVPYLTTPYLLDLFADVKHPRDKIKHLLAKGDLIHVKQGLYLLGHEYEATYSKEVLAGMLYGPSALSFEYALSYHGFIPERVEVITSVCFKRNKTFSTPVGQFTYKYMAPELYPHGTDYVQTKEGNFFIASPEKALCDLAYDAKITSDEEAIDFMLGSLRIEEESLQSLRTPLLLELRSVYKRPSTRQLIDALIIFQNQSRR